MTSAFFSDQHDGNNVWLVKDDSPCYCSFVLFHICILTGFSLHSACPFGVKYGRKVAFQSSDR